MRDDLRGRRAPRHLQRFLTHRYRRTPFGEPRYRLIWAASRLELSGGIWVDWQPGTDISGRNEGSRALRRRAELRWVRKYPGEESWMIERWLPAQAYGPREQWYRPTTEGGTVVWTGWGQAGAIPACGDYPERGDYEDFGVRMYWYPSERHLIAAVEAIEHQLRSVPADPAQRARLRTWRAQEEQDRRDRDFDLLCRDLFDDASPALAGAPMVGYGPHHRSSTVEMCERLGIRQHP